jgi:hypothetical protein
MLLSESASAQLSLTSTTGTMASPVYHYDIDVMNTGTTNIGTFWFSWLPGADFLPSAPLSQASPTGWASALTGSNDTFDGTAIQWIASSNAITPGHSLGGFAFTSHDSPAVLAGKSPTHPATDVLRSEVYSGAPFSDAGFAFNVAPPDTLGATTTTLASSQPTTNAGDTVTFTATVAPATPTGTRPTGTVSFSQDGNPLGTGSMQSDGTAQLITSTLPIGANQITAVYGGDANFATSTSSAFTETVNSGSAPTTTSLMTSAASIHAGDSVTFTATVAAVTAGGAIPTGTVRFSQDGNSLGAVSVKGDGTAALSTSLLPIGSDSITAIYSGDATYAGSTSTAVGENVAAPAMLVTTITKSTLPASLVAGFAAQGMVILNITNPTAATVKGNATLQLFASTNGSIDGSAIKLAQGVRPLNLKTTKSVVLSLPVRITPSTLPPGAYTLLARVIDPSANNNDSASGPTLIVATPFVALSETFTRMTIPASVVAGAKARGFAVLRITNDGNITTPGITIATLYASLSGSVDGTATRINSVSQPLRIRAGKSVLLTIPAKQIPAVAPGLYTILAQVTDAAGQLSLAHLGAVTITAS